MEKLQTERRKGEDWQFLRGDRENVFRHCDKRTSALCVCARACVLAHVCMHVCVYICTCVPMFACVTVCLSAVCIYLSVCLVSVSLCV